MKQTPTLITLGFNTASQNLSRHANNFTMDIKCNTIWKLRLLSVQLMSEPHNQDGLFHNTRELHLGKTML